MTKTVGTKPLTLRFKPVFMKYHSGCMEGQSELKSFLEPHLGRYIYISGCFEAAFTSPTHDSLCLQVVCVKVARAI